MKLEVDHSLYNATQQRVDRLVVQNRDKDLIIRDLEAKVQRLETTIKEVTANTAKAGLVRKNNCVFPSLTISCFSFGVGRFGFAAFAVSVALIENNIDFIRGRHA